jgi:hypothetical protein
MPQSRIGMVHFFVASMTAKILISVQLHRLGRKACFGVFSDFSIQVFD